ncbi:beta-ketoacyl-ACP synthase II [Sutterella megalosphaeroides]|uniref:3-oxoacyl-[acyl-carrier-protein] synthase 2 n=1 Tax=Sutterella megalosphaeroides TaxID=2494234 RepID=A0A2Z6IFW1_9BURK|nr:beta-ketoacyl-ACP synthase II [Sutterella megalosphaeroides]BBF23998.1 3-oxoacyl-[acyl-carrier-protein] synthase 2 [Sutterella megalosphaeroides]
MNRRVVVTGLGMVSPIGNNLETSWKNALAGVSGIDTVKSFDASILGCQIAGEVKDFDASAYLGVKEVRRFDRFVHFGVAAGLMALEDAKLEITDELSPEAGVAIGAGIGGIPVICANHDALRDRGARRISPFMIPGCIINMTSGQLAIMKNLKGPNIAHVTACSTGLHAIGEAMHIIRRGDAKVMIAGGCESTIHPLAMGAFDAMHALSRRNDDPKTASRPFDKDRDGFVMGEGAGVLVLEELEHALNRGAKIYAEVVGYGLTGDAYHITTPSTDGPRRCMEMALRNAGITPADVQYLNAHGTSTPVGDVNEVKAIKEVFGDAVKGLVVNSTKSMTGHLLGGAGGVESVFTVKALEEQISPPTINVFEQDPECDIDVCANAARPMEIRYAMKNSFGFGGTNSTVIYKRWTA